jgi:ATP-binding cassette, subfamily C (CFTR/MRP), member 1
MLNSAAVVDSIFLGWWTSLRFSDLTQGQYMGIYAAIGLFSFGVLQHGSYFFKLVSMHFFRSSSAYALRAFLPATHVSFLTPFVSIIGLAASLALFKTALGRVLKAPMSFFDTTPMG